MGKWTEEREKRRWRNGLISMAVIMALVSIAGLYLAKKNEQLIELRRGQEARSQMMDIARACKDFERTQGFWPEKVHQLEHYDYLKLRDDLWEEWYFTLEKNKVIRALSSSRNERVEPGEEIFYNATEDTWWGYGIIDTVKGDPILSM